MWLVCSCNLKIPVPSPICRNNSIYSVSPWSVSYPICLSVVFYHSMLFLPRLSPAGLCHGLAAVFLLGKTSESKDLVWLARQVHSLCGVCFLTVVFPIVHHDSCSLTNSPILPIVLIYDLYIQKDTRLNVYVAMCLEYRTVCVSKFSLNWKEGSISFINFQLKVVHTDWKLVTVDCTATHWQQNTVYSDTNEQLRSPPTEANHSLSRLSVLMDSLWGGDGMDY